MTTPRFLMCRPRVDGSGPDHSLSRARRSDGARQWERLVEATRCAAEVAIEEAGVGFGVFTADAALISGKFVVPSTILPQHRPAGSRRMWFTAHGFTPVGLGDIAFAGARDAFFDREQPILYLGHGWRTDRSAAHQIAEAIGVRALPLRLVDERFRHLDLALCPLRSGHILWYPEAFAPQTQVLIRRVVPEGRLIPVDSADAYSYACNAIEIGDTVVVHDASPKLRARLHGIGYRVFATDLSAFHSAGGSAKALTLRLDDGPANALAA